MPGHDPGPFVLRLVEVAVVLDHEQDARLRLVSLHGNGKDSLHRDAGLTQRGVHRAAAHHANLTEGLQVDLLLVDQQVVEAVLFGLREAAQDQGVRQLERGAPEDRQAARTAQAAQQHVQRDRVDLAGLEARGQRPTGLDRRKHVAQARVLFDQGAPCQKPLDHQHQLLGPDRLQQVVGGPHAQRTHGALHRRVPGQHDEVGAWVLALDAFQQVEPVHARHGEVRDDQVRGIAGQHAQGFLGAAAELQPHQGVQRLGRELAVETAVIDDDDARSPRFLPHPSPAIFLAPHPGVPPTPWIVPARSALEYGRRRGMIPARPLRRRGVPAGKAPSRGAVCRS